MEKEQQKCYLCNKNIADTEDHVVPECLFPEGKRSELVKLSCCSECNRSYLMDEEHFRDNLLIISKRSPNVEKLFEKLKRSCRRRPLKLKSIEKRIIYLNLITSIGMYLGTRMGLKFSEQRTNRVIEKIVKGLFFIHRGEILPVTVKFDIFFNPPDILATYFKRRFHEKRFNDIFYYAFLLATDSMYSGFWWLEFYESNLFLVALQDTRLTRKLYWFDVLTFPFRKFLKKWES